MTVQSCTFIDASDTQFDARNRMTATARFRIIDDTPGRSRRTILNESLTASPDNFPEHWDGWTWLSDTDNTTFATTFSIDLEDKSKSNKVYIATANYRPAQPGETILIGGNGNNATVPTNRPLRWGTPTLHVETRVLEKDQAGNPIVNSAGRPFDPGLEQTIAYPVRVGFYNYPTESSAVTASIGMLDGVNSVTWDSRGAREVWCKVAQPMERITEGSTTYYPVRYEFVYQRNGQTWDEELLNRGNGYLKTADDESTFTSSDEEVLLGSTGLKVESSAATYVSVRRRPEVNFLTTAGF